LYAGAQGILLARARKKSLRSLSKAVIENTLHIISWDIPLPANYGGVIDVFFKVKYLHACHVKIILHCFQYHDRLPQQQLESYCKEVHYYPRATGLKGLHPNLPYIVSSRNSKALLQRLLQDDFPILFDGLHTTYWVNHASLVSRKKILRPQNVEQHYYAQLAMNENGFFRKCYYYWESNRLRSYESQLHAFDSFITVASHDYDFFKQQYPTKQHYYIPSFHPDAQVVSKQGNGNYAMYHGNLSVSENQKSVAFLLQYVIPHTNMPWIIAGKNPSESLLAQSNNQIQIIANPSDIELHELLQEAHIHVLPSFQTSGLKLKLLHALFVGRFVLVNEAMLVGTGLDGAVLLANTPQALINQINSYESISFTEADMASRTKQLAPYDPMQGAQHLANCIFQ
jgi:glycosyltransferase involved in cell wall biosynthesis